MIRKSSNPELTEELTAGIAVLSGKIEDLRVLRQTAKVREQIAQLTATKDGLVEHRRSLQVLDVEASIDEIYARVLTTIESSAKTTVGRMNDLELAMDVDGISFDLNAIIVNAARRQFYRAIMATADKDHSTKLEALRKVVSDAERSLLHNTMRSNSTSATHNAANEVGREYFSHELNGMLVAEIRYLLENA